MIEEKRSPKVSDHNLQIQKKRLTFMLKLFQYLSHLKEKGKQMDEVIEKRNEALKNYVRK